MGEDDWRVFKVEIVNGCLIQVDVQEQKTGKIIRFFGNEILSKIADAMNQADKEAIEEYIKELSTSGKE